VERVTTYGRDYPDPFAADDLLAGLRNGAWLDRQDFPPLRYAVPGLIPEGSTVLVGAPKAGKSWLVLACGLAKASGGVALNSIRVDASPVLYLALEDGDRRMQSRCRTLLEGEPIPAAFDYLTRVESGRVIDTIAAWLARHSGAAPFVILDTSAR
jgi:AAA domain